MRRKQLVVGVVALVMGAGAAVLPGLALGGPPMSAQFTAKDLDSSWRANGGTATSVTVAQGATVTFDYPLGGATKHNADFSANATLPSCGAKVPGDPHSAPWTASCVFSTPGVYTFLCNQHGPIMSGTVNVADATGTVPGTTTATTPGTTTTGPGGTTTTSGSPGPGSGGGTTSTTIPLPPASVSLPAVQRGSRVRGSVTVGTPGSLVSVELSARTASLARAKSPKGLAVVGHFVRASSPAGTVRFSVALSSRAKRALRKHHRLALRVVVSVAAPGAAAQTLSARTVLKP